MDTKPRLGRGLSALLGESAGGDGASELGEQPKVSLPVGRIQNNPYQPRKTFDDEELKQLSESIRHHGVLQPLVVRQVGEEYQLIAGERRLRAAQMVGLTEVPVHLVAFSDQQVLEAALVENIQRADLNPLEKAHGFKEYLDRYHLTQEQLATRLGMDRSTVTNLVSLLNLPKEVQDAIRLEQISLGHAKILKGVDDAETQVVLTREVVMKGLSVKALEAVVKQMKTTPHTEQPTTTEHSTEKPRSDKTAHVQSLEDELRQRLAVKLEIRVKGKDKGQIVIGFESNDDFERIVEALRK